MTGSKVGAVKAPKINKGALSQFLRTNCRRQLYLSIYGPVRDEAPYKTLGIPPAAKWRPEMEALTKAGRKFGDERYAELEAAFPGACINFESSGKPVAGGLRKALMGAMKLPFVFLEGQFETTVLSATFYEAVGIDPVVAATLPPLADLRPDVILALPHRTELPNGDNVREVLPNGTTRPIDPDDVRIWLVTVDVKRTESINASYAVEVALYATLLSLWLTHHGLDDRYLVVDQPALWTLDPPGSAPLEQLMALPVEQRVAALLQRLATIEFEQYSIGMRKIFTDDLVALAELDPATWASLEPHVGSYCGMCDYYAHPPWAPKDRKTGIKAAPHVEHCSNKVKDVDHLSRIPDVSRGMARTLLDGSVATVTALSACASDHAVFSEHNRLSAERRLLPLRAEHLLKGTRGLTQRQCATLPRYSHLSAFLVMNFDASTGFTTGMAVYGNYRPHRAFGSQPQPVEETDDPKQRPDAWTVEVADVEHEFLGLQRVMYYLHDLIERAQKDSRHEDVSKATLQIYFWDHRQFEHFRTIVGRNLHRLLADPHLKGLIWLFPPEEILNHPQYAMTPPVVFVKDALRRLEILPVAHVQTLLGVSEALFGEVSKIRPFYREPLSDAIPKERIYEIWEPKGQHNRQELVTSYNITLRTLVMTLMRVTIELQKSHKGKLTGQAPPLQLMALPNYQGMSLDGQLITLHAQLDEQAENLASKIEYGRDPDELEAEYASVRLIDLLAGAARTAALNTYGLSDASLRVYRVTPTSCNSKLKVGDGVTFFEDAAPGLLNRRACHVLGGVDDQLDRMQFSSVADVLAASIVEFDRVAGVVVVRMDSYAPRANVARALMRSGLALEKGWSLVKGAPFTLSAYRKEQFARAMGNPSVAAPHNQALSALGKHTAKPPKPNAVPPTRGAIAFWDPPTAAATASTWLQNEIAWGIQWLRTHNHPVNEHQERAITRALRYGFSIVWGPPGTGKTNTGAAMVAAELAMAHQFHRTPNLLITGPNYHALEKFYQDVRPLLLKLPPSACRIRWIKREVFPGTEEDQLDYTRFEGERELSVLRGELQARDRATIVFAVVHQLYNLADLPKKNRPKGSAVSMTQAFDAVVVDEASQVDVAFALGALLQVGPSGRFLLLGDRLQMPPISKIEPPKGCEHIVGSILDYFHVRFPEQTPNPLLTNYRSCNTLVAFARNLGYPAGLKAEFPDCRLALNGALAQAADWPNTFRWNPLFSALLDPAHPAMALTYPDGKAGQANEFEALLVAGVVRLARSLLKPGLTGRGKPPKGVMDAQYFWTQAIGIVTPHRAQRAAIIRKLRDLFPADERVLIENAVDTVERFQGGERDIVLISFGVGDPDVIQAEEEFLLGLNRTNVAISRARAKAIVFVSDDLSYHLPDDADVVRTARAVKGFVHQFCNQRQDHQVIDGAKTRRVTLRWKGNVP